MIYALLSKNVASRSQPSFGNARILVTFGPPLTSSFLQFGGDLNVLKPSWMGFNMGMLYLIFLHPQMQMFLLKVILLEAEGFPVKKYHQENGHSGGWWRQRRGVHLFLGDNYHDGWMMMTMMMMVMIDDGAGEACGGGPETQRSLPWCHCPRGKRERIARGWFHLRTITIGIVVLLLGVHREAAVHWTQRLPRRGWSDHQPRRHNQNSRLGYFVRLCGFHFYNADLHTRNIMTHSASVALNSGQLTQGIKLTQ